MICPRCKGKGKMDLAVHEGGVAEVVEITCITCDGDGEIGKFQHKLYQQEVEMWCNCGNPSNDGVFVDDGEDPVIGKHHWNCKDCGKVLQVG